MNPWKQRSYHTLNLFNLRDKTKSSNVRVYPDRDSARSECCISTGNATNASHLRRRDALLSSTCRSIRSYLPDRIDSTPTPGGWPRVSTGRSTKHPVAAGITTCQPPTNPPGFSSHARASCRRTRPRVRNVPVDGERWSYANLTDAGSRHEPTIPRRRPVSTMSQPKALLPLPLGAVARLVARAGRAIYVGNRAALHDPARLAALFQRSDDLHRASSEGERREEGGDRGRDCLLQQHWRQSGGPPPKTQAEHCGRPRWRSLPFPC